MEYQKEWLLFGLRSWSSSFTLSGAILDRIACFSGKWKPRTWNISAQICQQNHQKWPPFWSFWRPFWNSVGILGIFLLKNVTPSHNLILKCKIPIDSIKQGIFILPAKFKQYFYTRAFKWMFFFSNFAIYITIFDQNGQKSNIDGQNISNLVLKLRKCYLFSSYLN